MDLLRHRDTVDTEETIGSRDFSRQVVAALDFEWPIVLGQPSLSLERLAQPFAVDRLEIGHILLYLVLVTPMAKMQSQYINNGAIGMEVLQYRTNAGVLPNVFLETNLSSHTGESNKFGLMRSSLSAV